MKKQQGFTLIELMVVVAIIGILAAMAIPQYAIYTKRARVVEGLTLASGAKTAVVEYYASNGKWPLGNNAASMAINSAISGNSTISVTVWGQAGAAGQISIKYDSKVAQSGKDTITLIPSVGSDGKAGSITWSCTSGTLPQELRPAECRRK